MQVRAAWIITALASLTIAAPSAQNNTARTQLEAARKLEVVDGDLKAAIKKYTAIVETFKNDRSVVADALVRLAGCYEKQGDVQARAIYERVVREYADQKDAAATAMARVGGAKSATASAKGDRAVWTGRDVDLFGTVSPDGRFLTYVDWGGLQNVMVRDLAAGTSRALTSNTKLGEFGYGQWSAISRDGQQVAYEWLTLDRKDELWVAPLRGSGAPAFRRIRQVEQDQGSVRPFDWSPDGKWLAVLIERSDRSSQIGIMSVQDGMLRPFKSIDWRGVNKMVFSPDGRFVAYDIMDGDARDRTRIYVMAVDASREVAVVDDASRNNVMGWSPDGHLVFTSDRTGTRSLWTVLVEDGRAKEPLRLAKDNVGSTRSLGVTPSGTLYVWQHASAHYVAVAPFDFAAGKLLDSGVPAFQRFIDSRGRPSWSPDGKYLSYISCGASGGGPCGLFVRSTETGSVHEVPHTLGYLAFPRLSPDGRSIITTGTDLKGRQGLYLIDVATGRTSAVILRNTGLGGAGPEWSPNGRFIRYMERRGRETVLWEREIGDADAKEIFRTTMRNGWIRMSPDGKLVGFVSDDPERKISTFVVASISGSAPRVLFEMPGANTLSSVHWQWTPDSSGVVVQKGGAAAASSATQEIWHLPLNGPPRKLDIDARQWGEGFQIHPDGRQIAFTAQAGAAGDEVWALENFLPKAKTPTTR
jgi:Tol biopolymer transport system component